MNNELMRQKRTVENMIGKRVRHFKGKEYLVMDISWHTENEEFVVNYRALYGDCQLYTRPLEMFVSKVDTKKYPEATQEYRMELIVDPEVVAHTDGIYHKVMNRLDKEEAFADGHIEHLVDYLTDAEESKFDCVVDRIEAEGYRVDLMRTSKGYVYRLTDAESYGDILTYDDVTEIKKDIFLKRVDALNRRVK